MQCSKYDPVSIVISNVQTLVYNTFLTNMSTLPLIFFRWYLVYDTVRCACPIRTGYDILTLSYSTRSDSTRTLVCWRGPLPGTCQRALFSWNTYIWRCHSVLDSWQNNWSASNGRRKCWIYTWTLNQNLMNYKWLSNVAEFVDYFFFECVYFLLKSEIFKFVKRHWNGWLKLTLRSCHWLKQ